MDKVVPPNDRTWNTASWKPVLRGAKYCSRACGNGCTKAEYVAAVKKGEALAKAVGNGFKPRVWENMGWYYSAVKGVAAIHPYHDGTYTCYFNSTPQFVTTSVDPQVALYSAQAHAERHVELTLQQLKAIGAKMS